MNAMNLLYKSIWKYQLGLMRVARPKIKDWKLFVCLFVANIVVINNENYFAIATWQRRRMCVTLSYTTTRTCEVVCGYMQCLSSKQCRTGCPRVDGQHEKYFSIHWSANFETPCRWIRSKCLKIYRVFQYLNVQKYRGCFNIWMFKNIQGVSM